MVERILQARAGPVASALLLSLLSTPVVALAIAANTFELYWRFGRSQHGPIPWDPVQALPIAFVAVLSAGVVGGLVGGRFVRRSPSHGLLLAVLMAWPAAIVTLPIVPSIAGEPFASGYVCVDGCTSYIRSGEPASGLVAYGASLYGGIVTIIPVVTAILLGLVGRFVTRHRRPWLSAVFAVAALASLNLFSFEQALPAFLCLIGGAVVWSAAYSGLRRPDAAGERMAGDHVLSRTAHRRWNVAKALVVVVSILALEVLAGRDVVMESGANEFASATCTANGELLVAYGGLDTGVRSAAWSALDAAVQARDPARIQSGWLAVVAHLGAADQALARSTWPPGLAANAELLAVTSALDGYAWTVFGARNDPDVSVVAKQAAMDLEDVYAHFRLYRHMVQELINAKSVPLTQIPC